MVDRTKLENAGKLTERISLPWRRRKRVTRSTLLKNVNVLDDECMTIARGLPTHGLTRCQRAELVANQLGCASGPTLAAVVSAATNGASPDPSRAKQYRSRPVLDQG